MPKIIDGLKEAILAEAKHQLFKNGYGKTTLRSVAGGCGIAVGTIYNYYQSKDDLIASFMLGDWYETLAEITFECSVTSCPTEIFERIYNGVIAFSDKYAVLFKDIRARRSVESIFAERHIKLRSQFASIINATCREYANHYTSFLPCFISEAILSHAAERRDFSELSEILIQFFIQ